MALDLQENKSLEEVLDKLIEECAEVIHAASKAKRFGMSNWHPETKRKNSDVLLDEIMDVGKAIEDARKFIPRPTIKEMVSVVIDWFNNSPLRQQQEFMTTEFNSLPIYHSSLGRNIRNYFNLWHYTWDKKIIENIDVSPEHPDAISMRVIEETWRQLNDR